MLPYDPESGVGSPGRPRARREQIVLMSREVVRETAEELVVALWFSTDTATWRRLDHGARSDLWERTS